MLNLDLIDDLYARLTKEQKQELISLLFKKSKQTMSYFRRTKDISLSKLEILADFFHMPLDYFRKEGTFKTTNVNGNNNSVSVGNVSVNTNLMLENESLRREILTMKETLKAKEETLKSKDETLKSKDDLIETLRIQVGKQKCGDVVE